MPFQGYADESTLDIEYIATVGSNVQISNLLRFIQNKTKQNKKTVERAVSVS
jgi:hypothetical protein